MFCTDKQTIIARKPHQCTWCAQPIDKGERHLMWKSVDDSWFTNRMHPECYDACNEECSYWGEDEYFAYSNDRPTPKSYSNDAESDSKNTNGLVGVNLLTHVESSNLAEWTGLEPATPGVTGPGL